MDFEKTDELIDSVYKAGMDGEGWEGVLNNMADSLCADGAWIAFAQPSVQRYKIIAPRSNPDVIRDYQNYWWQHDITTEVTSKAKLAQITSLADTGRKRFLRSKFYNDFWRHSGQPAERLAANLFVQGSSRISVGMQPKKGTEELNKDLLAGANVLLPHLSRAAQIHCAMRWLEVSRDVAKASPRKIAALVDIEGKILFADEESRKFFEAHRAIDVEGNQLSLRSNQAKKVFFTLLASCASPTVKQTRGGKLHAQSVIGASNLRVDVMPFQSSNSSIWGELSLVPDNAILVAFSDVDENRLAAREKLRELFELTPTEANVALELLRGDRRSDVANRLGVKLSTVRTHMMHIFEKAGVTSRAELIHEMVRAGVDETTFN